MTAPSMAEVLAEALRAQGLTDEPEKFDSDIHAWRCSHPDIYGRCDCFAETVRDLAQALTLAGFGHVATVEARWQEVTGDPTPEHAAATTADIAASLKALAAERDAAEAQVAAVRALLDGAPMVPQAMVRRALDGEGGR